MNEQADEQDVPEAHHSGAHVLYEELNPDLTQIDAYATAKQAIARDLHFIRHLLYQRHSERRDARCQALMAKLAEDHFTLAVLGQFKRGKSSLMNAIIGRHVLPTGVLPLTSAITILRFGPRERLMIEREASTVVDEVPLSQLADYVTERGNPGNRRQITRAVIEMPSPFLRRGLEFVDTPGVGSAIAANAAITQQFLPQCDAVIFITSVDSPLSNTEMEFLSQIREHVRKIFIVVNKTDLLSPDEREEVLQFIERNLRSIMDTSSVRLFPLSCQDGLDARMQGDVNGYARSGVKAFEETLSEFLSTEKMSAFLVSILDRIITIVDEELCEIEIETRAAEIYTEARQEMHQALRQRLEQVRASREHDLSAVRERLLAGVEEAVRQELQAVAQCEIETIHYDIQAADARSPWRMLSGAASEVSREIANRLNRVLNGWAAVSVKRLWPLFDASVRREMPSLLARLREIPQAAAEILHVEATPADSEDIEEFIPEKNVHPLHPARLQVSRDVPLSSHFLPVFLSRHALAHHCRRELEHQAEMAVEAVCDVVVARCEEAVQQTISRIRHQADDLEQHVETMLTGEVSGVASHQRERLNELRERMHMLRDRLMQSQVDEADAVVPLPILVESENPPEVAMVAEPSAAIDDAEIAHDLGTRGCPVCNRAYKAIFNFFAHWQYELSSDEASQRHFAAEGGLCRLHTWQLAAVASPQGVSQGYPRLVERIAREVAQQAAHHEHPAEFVLSLIPDTRHCRACGIVRTTEIEYLERLAAFIQSPEGGAAYSRSQGLCLRHLALLLEQGLPQEITSHLLRHLSRILSATAEDMQSFSLKRDALRRNLYNKDEDDAYLRALIRLAGTRYLAVPWNRDEQEV